MFANLRLSLLEFKFKPQTSCKVIVLFYVTFCTPLYRIDDIQYVDHAMKVVLFYYFTH